MKRVMVLVIVVALAAGFTLLSPVRGAASGCDLSPALDAIAAFEPSGDTGTDLAALTALRTSIARTEAECTGLRFTGDKTAVFGPVTLEVGVYQATAQAEGFFIFGGEEIEGTCTKPSFALYPEDAAKGVVKLFRVYKTCTLYLQAETVNGPFVVEIVRLP